MSPRPVRLQLSRAKGFNLQAASATANGLLAVNVARPSRWGNPWTADQYWDAGYSGSSIVAAQHCVDAYRAWLCGERHWAHAAPAAAVPDLSHLRGRNLACWCKLGDPCHADVLLELANQ